MTETFDRLSIIVTGTCLSAAGLLLAGCDASQAGVVERITPQDRGRYLVERVGMCADCHSPRGPGGVFDQDRWLHGAPLGFAATVPMPAWADYAPALAGLNNYTDEQAIALLTEGKTIHGQPLRPPMPPYRFNREDAEAVVAYLRSLK
ncbi:MAG: Cytochrome c [Rariglobus sp.]|jgi:mono/diheme cytochrome c family protein|nr:Cytochrome c [Rariglobus sp.]